MATDIREINLTDEHKRRIAELADRSGRPWREVLDEQLAAEMGDKGLEAYFNYNDRYIRDPQKRIAYFRGWIAQQMSHNPNFDDSRESIYFGRE